MKESLERDFHSRVKWVENGSRDTAENASLSSPILKKAGISRIALVSHASHLKRAVELFERQGLEVIPAPTSFSTRTSSLLGQVLPSAGALGASSEALRQWLGIFVQRVVK